jgi:hypothetical protein
LDVQQASAIWMPDADQVSLAIMCLESFFDGMHPTVCDVDSKGRLCQRFGE